MKTINWWDFNAEYDLPRYVQCKGGGGGGSSGQVSYPAYMETIHEAWLGASGDVVLDLTSAIAAAHSNSPFDGATAFDPASILAEMVAAVNSIPSWDAIIAAVLTYVDNSVINDAYVNDAADAQSDYLDDEYANNILSEFESGMRDINAVMTSSFVLGKAFILGMKVRDVAKFRADFALRLHMQRNELVMSGTLNRMSWERDVAALTVDTGRLRIVASKEETDQNLSVEENDAKWDLQVFSYGANMMASIAGGTTNVTPDQPSPIQSAIGGALSGAAIGSQIGGGAPGALVGGAIGLGMSFLQ